MHAELKSEGGKIEHKGWNPKKIKKIVIEFHGHLNSKYTYPINPRDLIDEIVVQVEE